MLPSEANLDIILPFITTSPAPFAPDSNVNGTKLWFEARVRSSSIVKVDSPIFILGTDLDKTKVNESLSSMLCFKDYF